MAFLKELLRKAARNFGYQIQKYPSAEFLSVPVFDLSVQLLMAVRGERLNFIQVGANDGRSGDPLNQYIVQYPWYGMLIEPQPDMFAKLCENYASVHDRLIFENVAIANGLSSITMYRGQGKDYPITSVHRRVVTQLAPHDVELLTVPCTTLDALIQKHGLSNVDILQIDAEGYDYDVLKTLDLAATSPLIIQFEHGLITSQEMNGAVRYLSSHGYRVLYGGRQIADTVALHKNFPVMVVNPRA
ncbi:MAG: FkbM family methyltransferase [Mesorhizobium sp.]|nr:MAG: FkbM family methyltransferase [Mesorhizobium sp.]